MFQQENGKQQQQMIYFEHQVLKERKRCRSLGPREAESGREDIRRKAGRDEFQETRKIQPNNQRRGKLTQPSSMQIFDTPEKKLYTQAQSTCTELLRRR